MIVRYIYSTILRNSWARFIPIDFAAEVVFPAQARPGGGTAAATRVHLCPFHS
jgi:hypothetical protein